MKDNKGAIIIGLSIIIAGIIISLRLDRAITYAAENINENLTSVVNAISSINP